MKSGGGSIVARFGSWGGVWVEKGKMSFALTIINLALTAYIAHRKGRNVLLWAIIGFILPVLSIIIILYLPRKAEKTGDYKEKSKKPFSKLGYGCLLAFIIFFIAVYISSVREPSINADSVRQKIKLGMKVAEVIQVLNNSKGRSYYYYYANVGGEEKSYSQEEFLEIMNNPAGKTGLQGKVWLVFMDGAVPIRVSFSINFGPDGKVVSLTDSRGWD